MLDQIKDSNQVGMFQLSKVLEFPEFVKQATQTTLLDVQELNPDGFAHPTERAYPVHTKADTWLSYGYFHKFGNHDEDTSSMIEDAIQKMASVWSIDLPSTEAFEEKVGSSKFEVTYDLGTPVVCGIDSVEELLKVANDVLVPGRYPLATRSSVAKQVLRAPKDMQLGDTLISDLHKVAGYGIGEESSMLHAINQRLVQLGDYHQEIGDGLREMQGLVKSASHEGVITHEMTSKVACALDAIDRFTGIFQRYSESFPAPENALYKMTLNDYDAFAKEAVQLRNGQTIPRSDLQHLDAAGIIEEDFGDKCASMDEVVAYVQLMPARRASMLTERLAERNAILV